MLSSIGYGRAGLESYDDRSDCEKWRTRDRRPPKRGRSQRPAASRAVRRYDPSRRSSVAKQSLRPGLQRLPACEILNNSSVNSPVAGLAQAGEPNSAHKRALAARRPPPNPSGALSIFTQFANRLLACQSPLDLQTASRLTQLSPAETTHGHCNTSRHTTAARKPVSPADCDPRRGDGDDGPRLKFDEAGLPRPAFRRARRESAEFHRHAGDHPARGDLPDPPRNISKPGPTSSRPTRSAPRGCRWPTSR